MLNTFISQFIFAGELPGKKPSCPAILYLMTTATQQCKTYSNLKKEEQTCVEDLVEEASDKGGSDVKFREKQ